MITARQIPREPQPDKPYPRLPPIQRAKAMTVCIAAICTWHCDDLDDSGFPGFNKWMHEPEPYIIGISDKMISDGDFTQSELPRPKFSNIVNSTMALIAGDVAAQTEVFNRTREYFVNNFFHDPRVIPIKEIAHRYEQDVCAFLEERRDMIVRRRTALRNYQYFLANYHHEDREEIIKEVKKEPEIETIITGIDESGPHIYLINHRGISCHDSTGFAIIGSGYFHAEPQLMRTRHSADAPYIDTLLLAYIAKMQAEGDPYVGKETDIFVITDDSEFKILNPEIVRMLKNTYDELYARLFNEATLKIKKHLIEEHKKAIAKQ